MKRNTKRTDAEMAPLLYRAQHAVGVITPTGAGTYGEVVEGMRRGNYNAETDERVIVVVPYYTHDLDRTSIKVAVHRALSENMNAIVTVGATAGHIAKQILDKESPDTPLFCCMVGDPVKTGLIPTHNDPAHNMVAINTDPWSAETVIGFMRTVLPRAAHVLVPLPTGSPLWLNMFQPPMEEAFKKYNFEATIVLEDSMHDLYNKVDEKIDKHQVLFIPEGNLLLDLHRALGSLCDRKKKPFFACQDWAVRNTASFGHAMSYMPLGEKIVGFVRTVLFDDKRASDLPFEVFPDSRHPMVNLTIAAAQGIDPDQLRERAQKVTAIEFCEGRIT